MKLSILILSLLFSSINYAAGTPFDGFIGDYEVSKQSCVDLNAPLKEIKLNWKRVQIKPGDQERSVKFISHVDGTILEESLAKDNNSTFSGDGQTNALWREQRFEKELQIDVWKSLKIRPDGRISYSILRKYYVTRPKHYEDGHNYCYFELVKQ